MFIPLKWHNIKPFHDPVQKEINGKILKCFICIKALLQSKWVVHPLQVRNPSFNLAINIDYCTRNTKMLQTFEWKQTVLKKYFSYPASINLYEEKEETLSLNLKFFVLLLVLLESRWIFIVHEQGAYMIVMLVESEMDERSNPFKKKSSCI